MPPMLDPVDQHICEGSARREGDVKGSLILHQVLCLVVRGYDSNTGWCDDVAVAAPTSCCSSTHQLHPVPLAVSEEAVRIQATPNADLGWVHQCLDDRQSARWGISATHNSGDNASLALDGTFLGQMGGGGG